MPVNEHWWISHAKNCLMLMWHKNLVSCLCLHSVIQRSHKIIVISCEQNVNLNQSSQPSNLSLCFRSLYVLYFVNILFIWSNKPWVYYMTQKCQLTECYVRLSWSGCQVIGSHFVENWFRSLFVFLKSIHVNGDVIVVI